MVRKLFHVFFFSSVTIILFLFSLCSAFIKEVIILEVGLIKREADRVFFFRFEPKRQQRSV